MVKTADKSERRLAGRYLRRQLAALAERLKGLRRGDDVEDVHQARVASRRIRAVLAVFSDLWPTKSVKRWRRQVRRLARSLGEARDQDVQIEFLRDLAGRVADPQQRQGVSRLLLRCMQQREALQPAVLAAGENAKALRVIDRMRREVRKGALPKGSRAGRPSRRLLRRAQREILARLEELCDYQDSLAEPQQLTRHHQMRIAAKRMRYTMEIFAPAYDGRLDDFIAAAKDLQTMLGELHDCDVWSERLEQFLLTEQRRTITYCGSDDAIGAVRPGVAYLREDRQRHREQTFSRLSLYWARLRDNELWPRLIALLQQGADRGFTSARPADAAGEPTPAVSPPVCEPSE